MTSRHHRTELVSKMNELSEQEPAATSLSPEEVYAERDRVLGQVKNIYQNLEKSAHPMLAMKIEKEAEAIVGIIAAIASLKRGEFQSAGHLVIEGMFANMYSGRFDSNVPQELYKRILDNIYALETHFPEISDHLYIELIQWIEHEGLDVQGVVRESPQLELFARLTLFGKVYRDNRSLNKILVDLQSVKSEFIIIGGMAMIMNLPQGGRTTRVNTPIPSFSILTIAN